MYDENIIVFAKLHQQHLENTEQVLRLLRDEEVALLFKERLLFSVFIDYLWYVTAPGKLKEKRKTTKAAAALCCSTVVSEQYLSRARVLCTDALFRSPTKSPHLLICSQEWKSV